MSPPTLPFEPSALPGLLRGARIQSIRQPGPAEIVLETRGPAGGAHWLLSAAAVGARFVQTYAPGGNLPRSGQFLLWLRTRLAGARVEEMTILGRQTVDLSLHGKKGPFHLVLEMNGPESNVLLLNGERRILAALHARPPGSGPGTAYTSPAKPYRYPRDDPPRLPVDGGEAARRLDERWREYLAAQTFQATRARTLRVITATLGKLRRRLDKIQADRAAAQGAETLREWAELLQIHRPALKPGMTELVVPNEFRPGRPPAAIPLDPALAPGKNIERLFQRYKKAREGAGHAERRLAATHQEIARWEALERRLAGLATAEELEAVLAELAPAERAALAPAPKVENKGQARRPILSRVSAEGYTIYVGRSKSENEEVTFRIGRGRDWWLHALGVPGAHVLVRNPSGGTLPPLTLRQAAWLAAYYSKGRKQEALEVTCTQRKHVRKVKGGEPGEVTHALGRTVWVNLADPMGRAVLGEAAPEEIEV